MIVGKPEVQAPVGWGGRNDLPSGLRVVSEG
jgi:hypothetical protein